MQGGSIYPKPGGSITRNRASYHCRQSSASFIGKKKARYTAGSVWTGGLYRRLASRTATPIASSTNISNHIVPNPPPSCMVAGAALATGAVAGVGAGGVTGAGGDWL